MVMMMTTTNTTAMAPAAAAESIAIKPEYYNCMLLKLPLLQLTTLIILLHTHNSLGPKELVESNIGDDGSEERVVYG